MTTHTIWEGQASTYQVESRKTRRHGRTTGPRLLKTRNIIKLKYPSADTLYALTGSGNWTKLKTHEHRR